MIFLPSLLSLSFLASVDAATSSGCGKQPTLTNGVHNINDREYILKIPENYDSNKPYHLIFGLHWRGGNMNSVTSGESVQPWYGLESRAQGSAVLVAPNGRNAGWANTNGEDVSFIDAIIKQVEDDLCVNSSSRFATGFSWGGGMSYALACSRAKEFKAVSVLSGGVISGCDGGNDPIPYLGIHGINDPVLPFDGGLSLANKFVGNNGCQPKDIGKPGPGSNSFVRTDFERCSKPVSFIAYDGGHDAAPLGVGNSLAPDATWEFFMGA
ncbi:feruloyl esterase C [Penicillium manginii]|jgi:poly(3-hydroxybutyrate) depolymerase|uniref:feruloyl esterase C n=1 Tax=Penicillium manginii TaxID=203109 RepID=UPI002546CD6E|nr:feruloyl esterase C [Penicillium manginii]KAJ5740102.1 feruloyl esterase C [Penicillium manginii]